ncbi:MAG: hypothetical protein JSW39_05100 [Desulfobacterales bacterium]|nr:MAG: hypothetical protein JSW39_05100 [Desulfobacterales bacterium]
MLSEEDCRRIYQQAYLPEHLPDYVAAISAAQPHLHGDFLCFTRRNHLIFIGYPLGNRQADAPAAYRSACQRFRPSTVAIIAPEIWLPSQTFEAQPKDEYFRLELPLRPLKPALAYMLRRAQRELRISQGPYGQEHRRLVKAFLSAGEWSRRQKAVFKRIPDYMKHCRTARLLEARKADVLVAFTLADFGSADFAFYLFNFRSRRLNVPGASDLLFYEMVNLAQAQRKKALNLGLAIHPGIRRFKEKWGGTVFLPYASAFVHRQPMGLDELLKKL